MKNRHPFQERFNDFIYHLARCVEIIFAIIILGTIACQAIPLVHELTRLSFVLWTWIFFLNSFPTPLLLW